MALLELFLIIVILKDKLFIIISHLSELFFNLILAMV